MKKEKTEELFVKWVDDQLSPEEQVQMDALLAEEPSLEAELYQCRNAADAMRAEIPASVEPPYGDFFNSQLMRKVDHEIASHSRAKKAERWWQSFQWAWAPAGALALVLAFFAGHRVAKPASSGEFAAVPVTGQLQLIDELPTVYFNDDQLKARVIAGADGEVSAIVVDGLTAIRDDFDIVTVSTKEEKLPDSYTRAEATRFR